MKSRSAALSALLTVTAALGCLTSTALADSRTSETVAPGGTVSTGAAVSPADPIQATVTTEHGGTVSIEKLDNPSRPGAVPGAPANPEDSSPKTKLWYGPAIRITPPALKLYNPCDNAPPQVLCNEPLGEPSERQVISVAVLVVGGTDLMDGRWRAILDGSDPVMTAAQSPGYPKAGYGCKASPGKPALHYLAGGDLRITVKYSCSTYPLTLDFYNLPFHIGPNDAGAADGDSLNRALNARQFTAFVACTQKCSRAVTATITSRTARKLGLKSATLASDHSTADATLKDDPKASFRGIALALKLSARQRKALKRADRITVTFHVKAVGPKGQVYRHDVRWTYKADNQSDSIT